MNWEAIGAIGEVIGALGVIVTLGYLAVQIRQNTASVKGSTLQAMLEASVGLHDLCASDSDLGGIFLQGIEELESLAPKERARFHFLMLGFLRRLENVHHLGGSGLVADDDWSGIRSSTLSALAQPGARVWWGENSTRFNPQFADWIAREVSKISD